MPLSIKKTCISLIFLKISGDPKKKDNGGKKEPSKGDKCCLVQKKGNFFGKVVRWCESKHRRKIIWLIRRGKEGMGIAGVSKKLG